MPNGVFSISLPIAASRADRRLQPARSRAGAFVAGPENRLLGRTIRALLDREVARYSPLVIVGPSGCGKTLLAQGLAEWGRQTWGAAAVAMFTGSELAEQLAEAVERGALPAWRDRLWSASLLVVDDLGQLATRRPAQQELIHILDSLADRGSAVVVTMHHLPAAMPSLLPQLRSRLVAGLSVPVAMPAAAARQELVTRIAAARGLALPAKAAEALAAGLRVSAAGLEAALMELELRAGTHLIDIDQVRSHLAARSTAEPPSLHSIACATAKHFGFKVAEIKSPSRRQALVGARGVAMYLARGLTGKSLQQVGAFFGGRDHTTVLHACRRTEKRMKQDLATREALADLKRLLLLSS